MSFEQGVVSSYWFFIIIYCILILLCTLLLACSNIEAFILERTIKACFEVYLSIFYLLLDLQMEAE